LASFDAWCRSGAGAAVSAIEEPDEGGDRLLRGRLEGDGSGAAGLGGGLGVHENDGNLAPRGLEDEPGGRHHLEGCANGEDGAGTAHELAGSIHGLHRHGITKKHDVRADDAVARWASRRRGPDGELLAPETPAATGTVSGIDGAVDLHHPCGAGALVQAVDVLGDDGLQQAEGFQAGQTVVGGVGTRRLELTAQRAEELPATLWIGPERLRGTVLLNGEARPEAVGSPERRDP